MKCEGNCSSAERSASTVHVGCRIEGSPSVQAVALNHAEQAAKIAMDSDIHLAAGDRLVSFVDLGTDPVTGETNYVKYVEF